METDLSITGKPAQFGRGLISEVGGKILDTFATCLASKLAPAEAPDLTVVKNPPASEPPTPAASTAAAASAAAEAAVTSAASEAAAAVAADHAEAKETGRKAGEATAAHARRRQNPSWRRPQNQKPSPSTCCPTRARRS